VIEKFPNTEYAEVAGEILKSLDVEMSPALLEKTIPPKPVPTDTVRAGAAPGTIAAAAADSLRAAAARADSLKAAATRADSLRATAGPGGTPRPDSLQAARLLAGQGARSDSLMPGARALVQAARADSAAADSQRVQTQIPRQETRVDSLNTAAPAKATTPADTAAIPEPERPEILGQDEAEQDTSSAK